MTINWQKKIQLQIDLHYQLNLLSCWRTNGFCFADTTKELIEQIGENFFSEKEEQHLLNFTTLATLSSLFRLNQFYQFDRKAEIKLKMIYQQLMLEIKSKKSGVVDFNTLSERHYQKLQQWLLESQPETPSIYPSSQPLIKNSVVCAEYSVSTQLHTLGIGTISSLSEPILDVGCGKEYHLVKYLRSMGFDAYGIDRDVIPDEGVSRSSWMDCVLRPAYWGTIISHLGFSNHFIHHNLKATTDHLMYAKKYVELLKSIKVTGKFYYAPDLPFIEAYLNSQDYLLHKKQIAQTSHYSVCIERLK
jgi:hypothetical protein